MSSTGSRRAYGSVRKLSSGRWQARIPLADGRYEPAPETFESKAAAEGWLRRSRRALAVDDAGSESVLLRRAPATKAPRFGAYATAWLAERDLAPKTRSEYRQLLAGPHFKALRPLRIDAITPAGVRAWHAGLETGPARKASAYGLLRVICNTAVADDVIAVSPCRIRGASTVKRQRRISPATLAELEVIAAAMPEQYRAAVPLAAWCAPRFGELAELRRSDVDLSAGIVHITRAVGSVDGEMIVGPPKSEAGVRSVAIPPHIVPMLAEHLRQHVGRSQSALLFTSASGEHLRYDGAFRYAFGRARRKAGRPDLRWHDLRHTGATMAAVAGATIAELMHRLGHSSPTAAMIYQHATSDRDRVIADALSAFHMAQIVPIITSSDETVSIRA